MKYLNTQRKKNEDFFKRGLGGEGEMSSRTLHHRKYFDLFSFYVKKRQNLKIILNAGWRRSFPSFDEKKNTVSEKKAGTNDFWNFLKFYLVYYIVVLLFTYLSLNIVLHMGLDKIPFF